jgi:hypothetical protein
MRRRPVTISMFVEDLGHERILRALVQRMAVQEGIEVEPRVVSAKGGHGRVFQELKLFQRASSGDGDLLLVAIDANCKGWNATRTRMESHIDKDKFANYVLACPDPHVERWYMADPEGLHKALDVKVNPGKAKCERDRYKQMLTYALRAAGHPVLLGGSEFADEIVESMDLFRAGKSEPSLKHFMDDLKNALALWR